LNNEEKFFNYLDKKIKPPITYMGGKQQLTKQLLERLPTNIEKMTYIELFCGGASLFFAKPLSKINLLNDKEKRLTNMFIQMQKNKDEFLKVVSTLPSSEELFQIFLKDKEEEDNFINAVKTFYLFNNSFLGCGDSFGYSFFSRSSIVWENKKKLLEEQIEKLKHAFILNKDAFYILERIKNNEKVFLYLDPPYSDTEQKYKNKFLQEDFDKMLNLLKEFKGKFMLSCYEKNIKEKQENWNYEVIDKTTTVNNNGYNIKLEKREMIVRNYFEN